MASGVGHHSATILALFCHPLCVVGLFFGFNNFNPSFAELAAIVSEQAAKGLLVLSCYLLSMIAIR